MRMIALEILLLKVFNDSKFMNVIIVLLQK